MGARKRHGIFGTRVLDGSVHHVGTGNPTQGPWKSNNCSCNYLVFSSPLHYSLKNVLKLIFILCVWVFRLQVCLCQVYSEAKKRACDVLKLELQTAVNHHVGARNLSWSPTEEEQSVLLPNEPSLQPQNHNYLWVIPLYFKSLSRGD